MDFKYEVVGDQIEIVEYIGFDVNDITIPSNINGYDVVSIAANAFRGIKMRNITFPDKLKFIGDRAFFECDMLEEVKLPETMEVCEEYAFYKCKSLKVVDMGGTRYIYQHCYEQCTSLERVTLSDEVYVLEANCFSGCKSLCKINIPSRLSRLEKDTFKGCLQLPEIVIPESVSYIGNNCFRDCLMLDAILIEGNNTEFGNSVFSCYEWKRPTKLDGTEDERYKPKSKVIDTPNKTVYCRAGSSAQKYARESRLLCEPLENCKSNEYNDYYEVRVHFRVSLFKTTAWGVQSRGMDSWKEQEALQVEMDNIISDIIPMTSLEKKYKTKYSGRSGEILWWGNKEEAIRIANFIKEKLNVSICGIKDSIEFMTETVYDY